MTVKARLVPEFYQNEAMSYTLVHVMLCGKKLTALTSPYIVFEGVSTHFTKPMEVDVRRLTLIKSPSGLPVLKVELRAID